MKKATLLSATTTYPNQESAENSVKDLVKQGKVACGSIEGPIKSIFLWNGKLCTEEEWKLTIKFNPKHLQAVESKILDEHPYEIPQWVTTEVMPSKEYHSWATNPI